MFDSLNQIDHFVFSWIQRNCRSELWDPILVAFRDKHSWLPLYIFLLSFLFFSFGKKAWIVLAFSLLLISLTDQINSSVVKSIFKRDRPCKEASFQDTFKPAIPCSGGFSFPSSHATNHMGLAVFLILVFGRGYFRFALLLWAFLVGFSQVYVGVHFPFDVIMGFLEGATLAFLCFTGMKLMFKTSFTKAEMNNINEV